MSTNLHRITNPHSRLLELIRPIYEQSFPEEERRDFSTLSKMVNNPEMHLYAAMFEQKVAGFAILWDLADFCYLEHIAIDSAHRGNGLGGELLTKAAATISKPLIFEVEHPTDEISKRRIAFYERFGYHLYQNFKYEQPSYDGIKPSVPMLIMAKESNYSEQRLQYIADKLRAIVYERFY